MKVHIARADLWLGKTKVKGKKNKLVPSSFKMVAAMWSVGSREQS